MKKLSMLLAVLFSFSFLLTACGGGDNVSTDDPEAIVQELNLVEISNVLVLYAFPTGADKDAAVIGPSLDVTLEDFTDAEMESFALALSMYSTQYFNLEDGEFFPNPEDDFSQVIIDGATVQTIVLDVFGVSDFKGPNYNAELNGYLFPAGGVSSPIVLAYLSSNINEEGNLEMNMILYEMGSEEEGLIHLGAFTLEYQILKNGNRTYARFVKSTQTEEAAGPAEPIVDSSSEDENSSEENSEASETEETSEENSADITSDTSIEESSAA